MPRSVKHMITCFTNFLKGINYEGDARMRRKRKEKQRIILKIKKLWMKWFSNRHNYHKAHGEVIP